MMDNLVLIEKTRTFIEKVNKKYPIKLAYLFGSVAKNQNNKMSDIDIALIFSEKNDPLKTSFIQGELIDLGSSFFNMPVDILCLDKASIFLKYQVIKDGVLLADCDERASFESLILREYFDFKYYSDIYDQAIIESIKNKTYLKS
ncbi:MAG: nucleotidyltransferase family protein [Clostridiaceae bacterium]